MDRREEPFQRYRDHVVSLLRDLNATGDNVVEWDRQQRQTRDEVIHVPAETERGANDDKGLPFQRYRQYLCSLLPNLDIDIDITGGVA